MLPELEKSVYHFLSNHIHVALMGPCSIEKTSFIHTVLKQFEREGYMCPFIDLCNITSHHGFLQQTLEAFKTKNSAHYQNESYVKETILDALSELAHLGEKVILTIDEFQKITELNDRGWLEATLRTYMQQLRNTTFLITGSQKNISEIFINSARPFFGSCQPINFL